VVDEGVVGRRRGTGVGCSFELVLGGRGVVESEGGVEVRIGSWCLARELVGHEGVEGLGFFGLFARGFALKLLVVVSNWGKEVVDVRTGGELERRHDRKHQQEQWHQLAERQAVLSRSRFGRNHSTCDDDTGDAIWQRHEQEEDRRSEGFGDFRVDDKGEVVNGQESVSRPCKPAGHGTQNNTAHQAFGRRLRFGHQPFADPTSGWLEELAELPCVSKQKHDQRDAPARIEASEHRREHVI
jgi:hypothetical protein